VPELAVQFDRDVEVGKERIEEHLARPAFPRPLPIRCRQSVPVANHRETDFE
jgi:hypothetical protein